MNPTIIRTLTATIIRIALAAVIITCLYSTGRAQCNSNNFTMSSTTVCGNEEVTFSITNPGPNAQYFWNFGQGGGVNTEGAVVTHTYPARDFDKTYNVTAFNNAGACIQQITVLSTPDAEISALTGDQVDDYTIAYCGSTSDFPEFELSIENTSSTMGSNTNYTIDWGDGTPPFVGATFTTLDHTYLTQGEFTLSVTVDGAGNCPSSTVEYIVFNSSDPGGSIVNATNTVTTCYPNTIGYPILGTENNIPGTTYEIMIGNELIAQYNHPPPDTFFHTFDETSCSQGSFPFDQDEFVIQMEVISPCQNKLSFVTARLGTPPMPEFNMDPPVICEGQTLLLTNVSEGSLSSSNLCAMIEEADWVIEPRTYNIIAGDTLSSETLELELLEMVPYTITMYVENMCGIDSITHEAQYGVTPFADAVAVLDQPNQCAPAIATFTNLSTTIAEDSTITYNWTITPSGGAAFINGTSSSDFEPEIEFTGSGNFIVQLTVENYCGSPQWDTIFDIRNKPGILIPEITNMCADDFTFTNNVIITGNPDYIDWTFSEGTPATFSGPNPPSVVFSGTGTYSISVTAGNTCGDSTTTEFFNLSDPIIIDAGNDFMACFNEGHMTLTATPAGGVWSGEGISGTDIFNPSSVVSSSVTLTYTVDNGICIASENVEVDIISIDNLGAGPDESACVNNAPFDLSGQNPAGGTWFGTGITAPAFGTFDPASAGLGTWSIGYIYTEPLLGCADTVYKNVEVIDRPAIAIVSADTVCQDAIASFSTGTIAGATATWDFGDGDTLSGFNVDHIYSSTGNYWVQVEVTSGAGCVSNDSVQIRVIDVPVAGFVPDNALGCGALIVNFDNQSNGHIESVQWDFGTGETSVDYAPQSISFPPGTYNDTTYYVTLTATNQCGEHSYTDSVFVTKRPVALFGTNVNRICPGEELFFNNISYNSPDGFLWDFGNGVTSTDVNPAPQVYPVPEEDTIYVITLVAFNECGYDTMYKEIKVKTVNVVSFFNTDPLSGCEPLTVNFISYSSLGASLIWDFADGNTSTRDTIAHIFQDAGTYQVTLAVDNGCSRDTSDVEIHVLESPDIEFGYPEVGCQHDGIQFTNLSQGGFGFEWDFGDGSTSLDNNPIHVYSNSGNYEVSLLGENENGCIAYFSSDVSILEKPLADFNTDVNNLCLGNDVQFTNLSVGGENFIWNFGDGTLSYQEDPVKTYSRAGVYDVSLVTNNDNFCSDTITYRGVIEIFPKPEADFDYEQTTVGQIYGEVEFNNYSDGGVSFEWDFGDGSASIDEDPVHQYSQSGEYEVMLVSENEYYCIDSVARYINVSFFGKLFVPNAFSPALGGLSGASVFLPKGVGLVEYEMEIYSSYGELLWRTNELIDGKPAVGWDGSFDGKALPQDVYVWKIRAQFDNGLSWQGTEVKEGVTTTVGTLTLIR
ncbi:MAG: PKD domain-containing protein [Bacteroidetes bacterium]|nr:PKD domain-containing protein [Bacteroidota bacterium]